MSSSGPPPIRLRPATLADAEFVYAIRNDPHTRAASLSSDQLSYADHYQWFKSSLSLPSRRLFIAEAGEKAIGSARMDEGADAVTLSWSIAPDQRGRGLGRALVAALAAMAPGRLLAVIKSDNAASRSIAEAAGFELIDESDGICHYGREPL